MPSEPSSKESRTPSPTAETQVSQNAQGSQEAIQTADSDRLRKMHPPQLELLPVELILSVFELLPVVDAVCLGLTCKRIYEISKVHNLQPRLDEPGTETLLCRLERDITGVSYCFPGQKLVRFEKDKSFQSFCHFHKFDKNPYYRIPSPVVPCGNSVMFITYCKARLLTNYQILGPQHGLPTSYLDQTYDHPQREDGICWKEEFESKVINGELFVLYTHTLSHEHADASAFKNGFETMSIDLCPHLSAGRNVVFKHNVRLRRDLIGRTERYDEGWCRSCDTDWETFIQWTHPKRGWVVTIRTYQGLGACRSPYDPIWQAIASIHSEPYKEVPGGAVKASWRA